MNYNYANLSDSDFERLSKHILEKKTGLEFRTFGTGADKGIDVKIIGSGNVIAQSKHMMKSRPGEIVSALKKEFDKIEKLDIKEYYLFVSNDLSPKTLEDIYNIFSKYMISDDYIYNLSRIDDFLSSSDNFDVVLKNPRLWFTSAEIMKKIINKGNNFDASALLLNLEKESRNFVRTGAFWQAAKILESFGVILLTGDAGVGKTTTSKILIDLYKINGYEIIFSSSNNYEDIKMQLENNESSKQIVYLDDFLGQRYTELSSNMITPLNQLINYIQQSNRKKLVINSRITVLNSALSRFENLSLSMHRIREQIYEIDMNKITLEEKAHILISNLKSFRVPVAYFVEIKKEKRYVDIVKHRNYTPRTIEYFTSRYNVVKASEYFNFIMSTLNNAYKMWDNEYTENIQESDRKFLLIVYTMGPSGVEIDKLNELYNELSFLRGDKSLYDNVLLRLEKSFISIIKSDKNIIVKLKNPSIYDYFDAKISSNYSEFLEVISESKYVEQVANAVSALPELSDKIVKSIDNIFNLKKSDTGNTANKSPYAVIRDAKILDEKYTDYFRPSRINLDLEIGELVVLFSIWCTDEFIDFYQINVYDNLVIFLKAFQRADFIDYTLALSKLVERKSNLVKFFENGETEQKFSEKLQMVSMKNIKELIPDQLEKVLSQGVDYKIEKHGYDDFDIIIDNEVTEYILSTLIIYVFDGLMAQINCFDKKMNHIFMSYVSQEYVETVVRRDVDEYYIIGAIYSFEKKMERADYDADAAKEYYYEKRAEEARAENDYSFLDCIFDDYEEG